MTNDVEKQAKVAAGAAALGAAVGLVQKSAPAIIHPRGPGAGVAGAAYNFSAATSNALKNHKNVVAALGAGATAVAGGPAAIAAASAAAVAAAPIVAGIAAVGAVGAGIAWLCGAFEDS